MDETRRNELAEILARRYRQPERVALLSRLHVDPEECTLGSHDPEEVAWRIVRWFADRGRLAELDRAARVGWLRRSLRRLSLASGAAGWLMLVLTFGADWFGVQARLCRLPLGQPALADACGAWSLGGAPTKDERTAWESRERGSCDALRAHVAKFPSGAYQSVAAARLTARRIAVEETAIAREHSLELHISRDVPPQRERAAAEADVRRRAQTEAERLCKSFTATGQNHLRSARIKVIRMSCDSLEGGLVCGMDAEALCALDERRQLARESCAEGNPP